MENPEHGRAPKLDQYIEGSDETDIEGNETFDTRYAYDGREYQQTKYEKGQNGATFIKGSFTGERIKTDPETGKVLVDEQGTPITEQDPNVQTESDKERYETWNVGSVEFDNLDVIGKNIHLSNVRHGRTERGTSGSSWGDGELATFPEAVLRPSKETLDAMVASGDVTVAVDNDKKRVEKFVMDAKTTVYREITKTAEGESDSVHLGAVIDLAGTPATKLEMPKLFNEEGAPRERQETSLIPNRVELDLDNPPKKMPYGRVKFSIEYGESTARTAE
ncbi:MAG: hypothetical protein V1907_01905 [Candidatus Kerfeldbacteria bacterium]